MKHKKGRRVMRLWSLFIFVVISIIVWGTPVWANFTNIVELEESSDTMQGVEEVTESIELDMAEDEEENLSIVSVVQDDVTTGKCGDNVTYTLDGEGTLTISGSGKMYDYDITNVSNISPFEKSIDIKTVTIDKGVTSIGSYV